MPEKPPARPRLTIASLADEQSCINGRTFEDREIVGPAVLMPVSRDLTFESCNFPGPIEHFAWIAPEHPVMGVIGLRDCVFIRCTFLANVGLIGPPALRASLMDDVLRASGE